MYHHGVFDLSLSVLTVWCTKLVDLGTVDADTFNHKKGAIMLNLNLKHLEK